MIQFWTFFTTLHTARQVGPSGPQPIAISDIYALACMEQMGEENMEFVLMAIPLMDQEYLKIHYEQIEKKKKSASKSKVKKR